MSQASSTTTIRRIGCVSYLNAKPLIDGLEDSINPVVRFDVPSRLLADLEDGSVDVALCPVIDFYRSRAALEIVPVGGIGCDGETLTVRLFSRVPIARTSVVHADTDSHTSVALMRVLLCERFGLTPTIIDYQADKTARGDDHSRGNQPDRPETMLLIGDKVVNNAPDRDGYPFQEDLGREWRELTGLPFVFAIWMTRADADLGDVPALLDRQRRINASRIDAIVQRHAAAHGWPAELAQHYLGGLLRFDIGPRQIEAIERFGQMAAATGVIDVSRQLRVRAT